MGEETAAQGTGFFVRAQGGQLFGISSTHYLGFDGPAVTGVDLHDVRGAGSLARATESWGRPGTGGITEPIVDLGDDVLILPLTSTTGPTRDVTLGASGLARVGDRVVVAEQGPAPAERVHAREGVVAKSTLGCVTVRLDQTVALTSQSVSPVLSAKDDTLVGVLSRGGNPPRA